eukprot:TRINITY_DN94460_c0_g1_i1.p1 TRINITY_DN94460_c0_g1~~TRINITY_DN94460_c0_g1_i1.p1  ORF type:complete len:301 (+),score=15.84 TRINITY_DN94460_c0_g1_i1:52-954(+)
MYLYKLITSEFMILLIWQILAAKVNGERPALHDDEWQALGVDKVDEVEVVGSRCDAAWHGCEGNKKYPVPDVANGANWLGYMLKDPTNLCWADKCGYFRCRPGNKDTWDYQRSPRRIFVSKKSWMTKVYGDQADFNSPDNSMFGFMFRTAQELCAKARGYSIYMDWLDSQALAGNQFWGDYLRQLGKTDWDDGHIPNVQQKLAQAIKWGTPAGFYVTDAQGNPPDGPFCAAELCCFGETCEGQAFRDCVQQDAKQIVSRSSNHARAISLTTFRPGGDPKNPPDPIGFAKAIFAFNIPDHS